MNHDSIVKYTTNRDGQILRPHKMPKIYNPEKKVGDKLTKLSKIDFSMECFTAYFLRFFTKTPQNLTFSWTAGYSPSSPSISGIFLKFLNFLRS